MYKINESDAIMKSYHTSIVMKPPANAALIFMQGEFTPTMVIYHYDHTASLINSLSFVSSS